MVTFICSMTNYVSTQLQISTTSTEQLTQPQALKLPQETSLLLGSTPVSLAIFSPPFLNLTVLSVGSFLTYISVMDKVIFAVFVNTLLLKILSFCFSNIASDFFAKLLRNTLQWLCMLCCFCKKNHNHNQFYVRCSNMCLIFITFLCMFKVTDYFIFLHQGLT